MHVPPALSALGALLSVEVNVPQPLIDLFSQQGATIPTPQAGTALIDTGASMTCVEEAVLKTLGINPIGLVTLGTAAGPVQRPLFPVRLAFPEPKLTVDLSRVVAVDLRGQTIDGAPLIALVGRDILSFCQFIYAGTGGYFSISY